MNRARRLPLHHVTIRVHWHDGGWTGTVCARPLANSNCPILPRIGQGRRDDMDALREAGARRARSRRPATLRERPRLVHGTLRAPGKDDAPVHEDLPRDLRALRTSASCSRRTPAPAWPFDECCARGSSEAHEPRDPDHRSSRDRLDAERTLPRRRTLRQGGALHNDHG